VTPNSVAPSRWNIRGIQSRVFLLVGLGVLSTITVLGWIAWRSLALFSDRVLQGRETLASAIAVHVDQAVVRELKTLQQVAAAPGTDPQVDDEPAKLAALKSAYLRSELMDRTLIVDERGTPRWQEPPEAPLSAGFAKAVAAALQAGRPVASVLVPDPGGDRLYLFVPMRHWSGGLSGLAVGEIDPASPRFATLMAGLPSRPPGSIDLLDSQGTVITSTDPHRRGRQTDHGPFLANLIRNGQPARGTCIGCHGASVLQSRARELVAFVPLSQAPWGVSVRELEADALGDVLTLRRWLVVMAPVLLGIGLLFAWGTARSVRRPIKVLTATAERLAGGELDRPIPPLGTDEVGRLGRALEHMRIALQSSMEAIESANQTLEKRVEERTRELDHLYRQLAERDEARVRLLRKVISAQEDERKRIARELHDETSQTLSALVMRLEMAVATLPPGAANIPIAEAKALAVRSLDELHRLIYDLRPSVLDDLGLWSAIQWYAERHLQPHGIAVRCEFSDVDRRLPPAMETALFRICQEAISNIARHAEAEAVLIQCGISGDLLTIEIEDDGCGFDPASVKKPDDEGRGWGLLGITERAELLGGQAHIDTAPGQGVRLVLTVRVPPEASRG
jgi:signal transduction histidine kinase